MNEKHIMMASLFAVLAVGLIGTVGMTKVQTGAVVQTTGQLQSRMCSCEIERYDYYGMPIGAEIHQIRVKSAQAHTDSACDNRCGIHYGKTKRGRKSVTGWAG